MRKSHASCSIEIVWLLDISKRNILSFTIYGSVSKVDNMIYFSSSDIPSVDIKIDRVKKIGEIKITEPTGTIFIKVAGKLRIVENILGFYTETYPRISILIEADENIFDDNEAADSRHEFYKTPEGKRDSDLGKDKKRNDKA